MGRGRGGYTEKQASYEDSGGKKVIDRGTIFIAERYIDMGYMAVFRRNHNPERGYDLTIKTSDDTNFVKNIEVKRIVSYNPRKIADRIKDANEQINAGDTIAILLPNFKNNDEGNAFANKGVSLAREQGLIKGPIEVWFSDKTCIEFLWEV